MKSESTPSAVSATNDANPVFDVREIPGRVKHTQIFQRWFDLAVGSYFILLNDHDPIPLRYQFEAEYSGAFGWDYIERGPDEFRVRITKLKAITPKTGASPSRPAAPASPAAQTAASAANGVEQIDVRGLEPPEPLIRILDRLESLQAGVNLRAHTDREPCHLFGEAESRGFKHDSREQPDGSWITVLSRR